MAKSDRDNGWEWRTVAFGLIARRWLKWLRFALGSSALPARSSAP
jgi:hypothetical protein